MRILLIGFAKIKYMPYLRFYLDNIEAGNDVTVVYWNRDGRPEDISADGQVRFLEFSHLIDDHVSPIKKIGPFLAFRRFVRRLLKKESFDLIVCLHTFPAILTSDVLRKQYAGRYIFDYRDSTYERYRPFRRLIDKTVRGSMYTFVSSDGFRRLLPSDCDDKIITSHNILHDSLLHRDEKRLHGIPSDKIRIAFWGLIRGEDINRAVIDRLASDRRFELHYYGREQREAQLLKEHAAALGADNVFFHGEYVAADRYTFVRSTDIIHNMLDDGNMMLAMSNKYYDGVIFRLPQLCMTGSVMAERASAAGVGLAADPYSDGFADEIYNYYTSLDVAKLEADCDKETERVLLEYGNGCNAIKRATSSGDQL